MSARPIEIRHSVPRDDLGLGLVRAEGVAVGDAAPELVAALAALVAERAKGGLDLDTEARRLASRDMLRNGVYKPTGRGKPASEYLLRVASGDDFPQINGPVDANNLVSLRYLVPISVWDLDLAAELSLPFRAGRPLSLPLRGGLAETEVGRFEVRLGHADERYVFNPTGQTLELRDLVCGCVQTGGADEVSMPLVTPIKDGMATKVRAETTRVAGLIYFPLTSGGEAVLRAATEELGHWLGSCGGGVDVTTAQLVPGQTTRL